MITREELYAVPIPVKTKSYSPVSHKDIIRRVDLQLKKFGYKIYNEQFQIARLGNIAIGVINIQHPKNKEIGIRFIWQNSYDKSKPVAFATGGQAWACLNGIIVGDIKYVRKHTGTVLIEIKDKIKESISIFQSKFELVISLSQQMKEITVTKRLASELLGRMYVEEQIISSNQLSIIKSELIKPTFNQFEHNNLWSFYNDVTFSFKASHPTTYLENHTIFHNFIKKEFAL